jgi:hypothetical protein
MLTVTPAEHILHLRFMHTKMLHTMISGKYMLHTFLTEYTLHTLIPLPGTTHAVHHTLIQPVPCFTLRYSTLPLIYRMVRFSTR